MSHQPVVINTSYARGDPHPTYRILHDQPEVDESDDKKKGGDGCCGCVTILILIPVDTGRNRNHVVARVA